MPIVIKFEKCWVRNVKSIRITEIQALSKAELPAEYTEPGKDYVHLKDIYLTQWNFPECGFTSHEVVKGICRVGATAPAEDFFNNYVPFLRRCAQRLKEIKEEWQGQEEIQI